LDRTLQALYQSDDYRIFLRDYFQEQKRLRKAFSHRFFARLAGFESSGYLAHVMAGERNLTESSIRKVGKAIGLKGHALAYLESLVLFNQAKSAEEKIQRWKVLEKMRDRPSLRKLDEELAADYFRQWYTPALRELAVHADWKGDFGRLGAMVNPAIPADKVKTSLAVLLKIGLLAKDVDGRYRYTSGSLTTEGVSVKVRRNFRLEMMFRAIEAMDALGPSSRHLSGVTVAMSEKSYAQASSLMDELRRKLLELAQQDERVDRVYQFNFQGFPLSVPLADSAATRRRRP
jgi:uncharacterized protein (TIGR02147 family)